MKSAFSIFISLITITSVAGAQSMFTSNPFPGDPKQLHDSDHWMAIIGDSGTTGAASALDIHATAWSVLSNFASIGIGILAQNEVGNVAELSDFSNPQRFGIDSIRPMTRVVYSAREFETAESRFKLHAGAQGSLGIDVHEHGNGYLIGRALGMNAEDIVLVGQDGKQTSAIPIQFERIFEMNTQTLPPLVIVSFTANDFCDNGVFSDTLAQRRAKFEKTIREAWEKSAPFMIPHRLGTRIVVLPSLEIANVLTNDALLQQKVFFQGMGEVTCSQVRNGLTTEGFLSTKMTQSLGGMCKSVLFTKPTDTARVQRLRDVQNELNSVWKAQIDKLNEQYRGDKISWTYVESLRQLQFSAGDLAHDCFHPGARGHEKIADAILREVFKR